MNIYDPTQGNFEIAKRYHDSGLNIIPLRIDGTRHPKVKFSYSITKQWYQVGRFWSSLQDPSGIAILCGKTSGFLEVIDFDYETNEIYPKWKAKVDEQHPSLLATLPIVQTPKGKHVYYRCPTIEGNQRLAVAPMSPQDKEKVLIETRGLKGFVVAPMSPLTTHESTKPYVLLQGDLLDIPTITPKQRDVMIAVACSFDRRVATTTSTTSPTMKAIYQELYGDDLPSDDDEYFYGKSHADRPGDAYNKTATWAEILEPHGWQYCHTTDDVSYWRRPEKIDGGVSASTGYKDTGLLYVFSTAASPFLAETTYSKFSAYAHLNHDGSYHAATIALADEGYAQAPDISDLQLGGFYD